MTDLHFPWLSAAALLPLLGALCIAGMRNRNAAWRWCLAFSGMALACSLAAWGDFISLDTAAAGDPLGDLPRWLGSEVFAIDQLSAPLVPMGALLFFLITLATQRGKGLRFPFAASLISQSILLATLSCRTPWGVVLLLAIGVIPPWWELRERGCCVRVYAFHMASFVALLVLGWWLVELDQAAVTAGNSTSRATLMFAPLILAIFIRTGTTPFHCWMTDLFEHATFGTSLVYVTPMVGVYAALRLLLPVATEQELHWISYCALGTAVYAAGLALVQKQVRSFFCYLLLSHAALVLFGVLTISPLGLTGALCIWLSMGISLSGLGLTLRALEARHGRLSLADYRGAYEHTPLLAVSFLITGLASVGFPGTLGFLGTEILVDGAIHMNPLLGVAVVVAATLNGIAVVQTYFKLFTGTRHVSPVPLHVNLREKVAMVTFAAIIFGGGMLPQPGVQARFEAAEKLLGDRSSPRDDHSPLVIKTVTSPRGEASSP